MENSDLVIEEIKKNRRVLWLILGVLLLGLGITLAPARGATGAVTLKLLFLYSGIGILVVNVLRIVIASARRKDKPSSKQEQE